MELHDLISLNQSNQLSNFNESAIDAPSSYFQDEIKANKKSTKFKIDHSNLGSNLGCYVNNAFMSSECIMDNQLNHSKETCFNGK